MSRNFTSQKINEAIKDSGGLKLEIAKKLNCNRETLDAYLKKFPECQKSLEREKENVLDIAEAQVYKRIKEGNDTLLIFFLKTRGKHRGYTERQEIQHNLDGISITVIEAKKRAGENGIKD